MTAFWLSTKTKNGHCRGHLITTFETSAEMASGIGHRAACGLSNRTKSPSIVSQRQPSSDTLSRLKQRLECTGRKLPVGPCGLEKPRTRLKELFGAETRPCRDQLRSGILLIGGKFSGNSDSQSDSNSVGNRSLSVRMQITTCP
jgi:hypothetical protein